MAIRDVFKISRKTFFNPTGWVDLDYLKYQNNVIYRTVKGVFTPPTADKQETFEEAMKRLNLTEEDVAHTISSYRMYAFVFALFGLLIFAYAFYLLFGHHSFLGCGLGLGVSALFFAYAFKYDFWSFQMQRRQLGATFTEWKRNFLGEKGGSS